MMFALPEDGAVEENDVVQDGEDFPPARVDGARLHWDGYERRYILYCEHHGARCSRRRAASLTQTFGIREPVAFLHAWHRHGCREPRHNSFVPTAAQVHQSMVELGYL